MWPAAHTKQSYDTSYEVMVSQFMSQSGKIGDPVFFCFFFFLPIQQGLDRQLEIALPSPVRCHDGTTGKYSDLAYCDLNAEGQEKKWPFELSHIMKPILK